MIKSVSMVNFKGETEDYDLTGCDLITGPNGSGKTRLIQAIEFCLRGSISAVNTNEELFSKFSSGPKMSATVFTSIGTIERGIKEESKIVEGVNEYKYTGFMQIDTSDNDTITGVKACEQWIKDKISIPSVSYNFKEFEDMNTTQRRDFIKGIVNFSDMAPDQFIEALKSRVCFTDADPEYSKLADKAITEIEKSVHGQSGESLINSAMALAELNFKTLNKQRKADAGGAAKLTQLKNERDGNIRSVSKLEASTAEAQAQLTEQNVKLSQARQIIKQKTDDIAAIERLIARKQELSTTDYDLIIEAHKANRHETEAQIQGVPALWDNTKAIAGIQDHITLLENGLENLYGNIAKATESTNGTRRRISESEEMLLNLQGEFKCPLTKMICTADMEGITQRITESMDSDYAKLDELSKTVGNLSTVIATQKQDIEQAKTEIKTIQESERLYREHRDQIASNNRIVTESVHAIDQQIAIAVAAKSGADSKIHEIDSQISALMCKQYGEFEDPEITESFIESLTEQLQVETKELVALKEKQNLLQNQMRAVQDSQKSELEFKVWSDIKAAIGLKGIQGDMIKTGLSPVVEEMNTILLHLGRPEEFYFEFENKHGAEQFNFGWVRDGERINFDSLSKGEQLTTAAGLVVIFLEKMRANLKLVMIDEINQLYGKRRDDFFEGFSILSARLDNVIVAGAIDTAGANLYDFELTELYEQM